MTALGSMEGLSPRAADSTIFPGLGPEAPAGLVAPSWAFGGHPLGALAVLPFQPHLRAGLSLVPFLWPSGGSHGHIWGPACTQDALFSTALLCF